MIALCIAVLSAGSLIDGAQAQNYTVHSSFIFANTGDRTPLLDTQINPTMTNLGAQQMYNLVSWLVTISLCFISCDSREPTFVVDTLPLAEVRTRSTMPPYSMG